MGVMFVYCVLNHTSRIVAHKALVRKALTDLHIELGHPGINLWNSSNFRLGELSAVGVISV